MRLPTQTPQAGDAPRSAAAPLRRDLRIAILIGLLCLVVYNANLRVVGAADTFSTRYLPFGILTHGTVVLDPILEIAAQGRKGGVIPGKEIDQDEWLHRPYWVLQSPRGYKVSMYPIAIPVLVAPLYAPAIVYLNWNGWEPWRVDWAARVMEKVSASIIASLSAALLYLLLRRRASVRMALLLTLAYAFATDTWTVGSQALWQHGMTELLLTGLLLVVTGPCTPRAALLAGALCGLVACNRPPDSLLAGAIGLYGLFWAGRMIPWLLGGTLIPLVPLFIYNLGFVGHWAGGYGLIARKDFFIYNAFDGLLGMLFSPARGLFFYSPFLLFLPVFARRIWRDQEGRFLSVAMAAAFLGLLGTYLRVDWTQGYCWGPRYLSSAMPALFFMLPPVLAPMGNAGRALFAAACLPALVMQIVGAFWYNGASDTRLFAGRTVLEAMEAVWRLDHTPAWVELQHGPADRSLTSMVRGGIDRVATVEGTPLRLASGRDLRVEGWALVNGRTPADVLLMLDNRFLASSGEFSARPDVSATLDTPFAAGWRFRLPARPLSEGEHVVSLFARASVTGEPFYVGQSRFEVAPRPALESGDPQAPLLSEKAMAERARLASKRLTARQHDTGYWLTAFTDSTRYETPQQELNTYLNAVLIDLLAPVAEQSGLAANGKRVREYLTSQIEDGGLVRYHGRPDAPAIGTLGCAITPDSDDTTLVWRVAPLADRRPLAEALATIRGYRTEDGLYKTWLSPREKYQCLDPGKDPNPADAAIQMHIWMLLAKEDPAAARSLCTALGRRTTDPGAFVYYSGAPIIPLLRQEDLRRGGCQLELPQTMFTGVAAGQREWIHAAQLLIRFQQAKPPAAVEVNRVLAALSTDDFARIAHYPPLLYHNDLTATVRRYYWSEDAGYAIWLRLYGESRRRP